jgi:hypothetical protein
MDLSQINFLAVIVSALVSFLIGGLWYSNLLFGKVWMQETGLTDDKIRQSSMIKIFGISFLLALIISFNLAAFLGPESDLVWGLTAGGLAGIGWVAASLGILYLFERRSLKLFFINSGYQAVTYIISGGIIGAWH